MTNATTLTPEMISAFIPILLAVITSVVAPLLISKGKERSETKKNEAETAQIVTDTAIQLIDPLKKELQEVQETNQRQQEILVQHEAKIVSLTSQLQEARNREAFLLKDNKDLKTENERLKNELGEAKQELAAIRDRVAFLESRGKKR